MDLKLEVVVVPVSDVDRAKAFYEKVGFRLDIDYAAKNGRRIVQFTPPASETSIHIGKGITHEMPGSLQNIYLIVSDVEAARTDLASRGIEVSEVFHYDGLLGEKQPGPDPKRGSYGSFASFKDPDGNSWLLQEVTTRLPGREWKHDPAPLGELLREAEQHHANYEKTHAKHNWWDWYAPYIDARQTGGSPEDAIAAADRYMKDVRHIASL